ncbi:MAG: prepilin-type N-terminal cleavage/methylation domain-containing protein [Candidatus Muiribacteriota bacterium]|jgi:prepilin-type N-terminal cleavage/methylation domain-containing protein
MNKKAFSLVEIMLVVAILTIVVIIGMPYYREYVDNAREQKTYQILSSLRSTVKLYQMDVNNTRNFADKMRLDNGGETFSASDLEKYGYSTGGAIFTTAWGENFSFLRKLNATNPSVYSLFVNFNVYKKGVRIEKEEFIAFQGL